MPSFLRRVGAQAPAVMTSCFALNVALLVTTVTTGPGVISVTTWLSSSTPPFFLYRCYTVGGNQEVTRKYVNIGYTMKPRGLRDLDSRGNLYKHPRAKRKGVYGFQGDLNPVDPLVSSYKVFIQ